VRKEISSQHPANEISSQLPAKVISSQPSPMEIREGVRFLFHMSQTCFYKTLILFT
jgi:hypothetical protein